jgi:hypothetical protein
VTIAETLFSREGLLPLAWRAVIDPLVMDRHVDRYRKGRRRLEALCGHYGVTLRRPHDAGADAVAAVLISRTIGWAYPQCGLTAAGELTRQQMSWHRSWAAGYDSWRREQGLEPLREEEYSWPWRRPTPPGWISAAEAGRESRLSGRCGPVHGAPEEPTAVA